MLNGQIPKSTTSQNLLSYPKPFLSGTDANLFFRPTTTTFSKTHKGSSRLRSMPFSVKAVASATQKALIVRAVITVKITVGGFLSSLTVTRGLDDVSDLLGNTLVLELLSADLDRKTGGLKPTLTGHAHRKSKNDDAATYEVDFTVPVSFGDVGAVLIENEHHKEMYLQDIVIDGLQTGKVTINCSSWVHSKFDNPAKRIFFPNKSYLPSKTPSGVKIYREQELAYMRGDGTGERKTIDRIYDYDTYNDIGNPDSSPDLARPVLGGKEHPYPRRCRTGRPRCKTDPLSESRSESVYVPRDESFSEIKSLQFSAKTVYSVLHAVVPSLETAVVDSDLGFPFFTAIDSLFNEGINLPPIQSKTGFLQAILPRIVKVIKDVEEDVLCFETPALINKDKFAWFRDEEFSRQTLAGINPYVIQAVTEWPIKSTLDPTIYGPAESAITKEIVEREIRGFTTVEQAVKDKKLFIIDYHDLLLPYVHKVRGERGTTLYGSRALFFLTPNGTLKPLAIELVRPPSKDKPQWKQVFTPGWDATACWLWRLAKVHFLAHDSGVHQLVTHWLRTHCATEPYIIATNRQLSAMHPIYRLLHPHLRYTMEINALARVFLINGDGVIESSFSPGKYSMELCSAAYDQLWQFDTEALPNDLIKRGLAVEDPTAPHGLKLMIEDYPFAQDGLVIWDSLKQWVTDYVNHYYPDPALVQSDTEIQAWWTEIRTVGHGDKKDEPWWPVLKTPDDLIQILTTIIWVTSGHHAAVNFGQYHFAGYFPNRPTTARINMPTEDPKDRDLQFFLDRPEAVLLATFPSQLQATKVMAILDVLSSHSPDEEYLGVEMEPSWKENGIIKAAFERFSGRLKELEGIIDARNMDPNLRNRNGAGVVPYELLKPFSVPGVTGMGVPTSISI